MTLATDNISLPAVYSCNAYLCALEIYYSQCFATYALSNFSSLHDYSLLSIIVISYSFPIICIVLLLLMFYVDIFVFETPSNDNPYFPGANTPASTEESVFGTEITDDPFRPPNNTPIEVSDTCLQVYVMCQLYVYRAGR